MVVIGIIIVIILLLLIAFSLSAIAGSAARLAQINEVWARENGLAIDPPKAEPQSVGNQSGV